MMLNGVHKCVDNEQNAKYKFEICDKDFQSNFNCILIQAKK